MRIVGEMILAVFCKTKLAALAFSALALLACPVAASTGVLDIGGPADGFDPLGPSSLAVAADDGAAATFQFNSDLVNASFEFGLYCFKLSGCSGLAYLTSSTLGSIAGLISVVNVAGAFGTSTLNTAFSGIDLVAGTYSVALQMTMGLSNWVGSQLPLFSGDGRVTSLFSALIPDAEGSYFPTSSFVGANSTFQYVLTAISAIPPVPLPAIRLLMLGSFGIFGVLRRRRKSG